MADTKGTATMADNSTAFVRKEMMRAMPAPASETGIIGWMRKNLFDGWANSLLTIFALWLLYQIVPGILNFNFFDAVWSGTDRTACLNVDQGGALPEGWKAACWPYVGAYLKLFIYGRYPDAELWRANLTLFLFFAGLVPLLIPTAPFKGANLIFMLGVFPITAFILLSGGNLGFNGFLLPEGFMADSVAKFWIDYLLLTAIICGVVYFIIRGMDGDWKRPVMLTIAAMAILGIIFFLASVDFGLEYVETDLWGGFLMTLVIAVTGIVASLPIGIMLALGRRSNMPIVKLLSVVFIEFWRGVPLITVLFMSSVVLPLFLPDGVTFDKLLRALIGVALFSSAYMAEVVRGGLQAIPKGQYEGAMALGLGYWQMMQKIILPQALKIVIPGIVNTFIGLFKDTTLVSIIGLLDFLGMINSSHADATWASPVQAISSYIFCAFVFFIFCFSMARYSLFMERRLDTGHR
jgi:general L-amino acid transport system permease protein